VRLKFLSLCLGEDVRFRMGAILTGGAAKVNLTASRFLLCRNGMIPHMMHDAVLIKALAELKARLQALYPGVRLILFGSAARGEMDEESDVDVLVLTNESLDMRAQDRIVHEVFAINLHYDTNISVLITDRQNWEQGVFSVLPIRKAIEKEGVTL
jgi:uncharacterized protein